MKKNYVVTVCGRIAIDTTVAVIAGSEEEAARLLNPLGDKPGGRE